MTPQEITEGNKLIAEFMGYKVTWNKDCLFWQVHDIEEKNHSVAVNRTKYHSSWDWLITVVEKIEKIGYWTTIHSRYTIIGTMGQDDFIVNKSGERIEATWLAVVEFIKWHNQQK